jgi:hypothetical protein
MKESSGGSKGTVEWGVVEERLGWLVLVVILVVSDRKERARTV